MTSKLIFSFSVGHPFYFCQADHTLPPSFSRTNREPSCCCFCPPLPSQGGIQFLFLSRSHTASSFGTQAGFYVSSADGLLGGCTTQQQFIQSLRPSSWHATTPKMVSLELLGHFKSTCNIGVLVVLTLVNADQKLVVCRFSRSGLERQPDGKAHCMRDCSLFPAGAPGSLSTLKASQSCS